MQLGDYKWRYLLDIRQLRRTTRKYLSPLLSAKVKRRTVCCSERGARVASLDPNRIAIKANDDDTERIVVYRNPGFVPEELQLAKDFMEELFNIHEATSAEYRQEIFTFLPARAIARHLSGMNAVKTVIRQFEKWASRTYEGNAITSSVGIDPYAIGSDIDLEDIFEHDFSAVLSNGFDTLLVVSPDGKVAGAGQLVANVLGLEHTPYRLNSIADWCIDGKVALVLNRLGEQLVFRNKKLVFAKRGGKWQYYAHEMYVRQLQPPQNRILRESIYQSCLDISFARTGGCIIVVRSGSMDELIDVVSDEDRLDGQEPSIKAKTIKTMANRRFQDLDRRLRQELLALDGATVLTHLGDIVAVGAIISVPSGSEGGGRRAAAKKGSCLGLGIKVSEDGEISVFKNGGHIFDA
jgi:DNA integrity scanning protein DisA with diadenylate cyclase activity